MRFFEICSISERAKARLPDSSPALIIDIKSFEKILGNFSNPEERVPPESISLLNESRIL